jgi:hypothetical protein
MGSVARDQTFGCSEWTTTKLGVSEDLMEIAGLQKLIVGVF